MHDFKLEVIRTTNDNIHRLQVQFHRLGISWHHLHRLGTSWHHFSYALDLMSRSYDNMNLMISQSFLFIIIISHHHPSIALHLFFFISLSDHPLIIIPLLSFIFYHSLAVTPSSSYDYLRHHIYKNDSPFVPSSLFVLSLAHCYLSVLAIAHSYLFYSC
jgi:hypothetical protein